MATMIDDELGRIPMSPYLTATLTRAADYATAQSHREVTLEHLLLALAEDPEASVVLKSSDVDIARLLSDVSGFLGRSEDRMPPGGGSVVISQDLKRILEAAAAAAQQGRRREINGAIVLAAIVGDGKSAAANLLRSQGLTFEAAIRALQRASASQAQGGQAASAAPAPSAPSPPSTADDILAAARERAQNRSAAGESMFGARPAADEAEHAASEDSETSPYAHPPAIAPETERGLSSLGADRGLPGGAPAIPEVPLSPPAPMEEAWRAPPQAPAPAAPRPAIPQPKVGPPPSADGQPPTFDLPSAAPVPPPRPWTPPAQSGPPEPQLPMPPGLGAPPATALPPMPRVRPMGVGAAGEAPPPIPPPSFPPLQSAPAPARPSAPYSPPAPDDTMFSTVPGGVVPDGARAEPPAALRRQPSGPADRKRPGSGGFVGSWPLVESGQLIENIPRRMRTGVPVVVEARVAKSDVKALAEGLQGGGAAYRHEIVVTKAMSVRLRAPDGGFWIETRSPETQWIENVLGLSSDDYASWRWTVTPRERGRRQLQLIVSARTVGADGMTAETALPDQVIDVRVGINYGRTFGKWIGWAAAAVVGGLLARFGEGAFEQGREIIARLTAG